MPVLRNRLSMTRAGGPRQFSELRDKIIIKADGDEAVQELRSELISLGMTVKSLDSAPVVVAEPEDKIETVMERLRIRGVDGTKIRQATDTISKARSEGTNVIETTSSIIEATRAMMKEVRSLDSVSSAKFVTTKADYGPENLRLSPIQMPTIPKLEAAEKKGTLKELTERLGVTEVWETTRGENATVVIFDTGFAEDLIDSSRVVGTYHHEDAESPWAPAEGHGTMCAGAAAANKEEDVPYDGIAPEAKVALARITDSEGQIRGDIISEAWDWAVSTEFHGPAVINHSYGTPICSGRPKHNYCSGPEIDVVKIANEDPEITSVYAAGNEAMTCGHRPSGITNAVTGTNSLASVLAVGALRFDGREAQRYSSHGRGDCSPVADPKPNVSCAIPGMTYYGTGENEKGWEIKDMSMGVGGSGGGTSHAAPMTAGFITLMQSAAVEHRERPLETEEIKSILHRTAKLPHANHVNRIGLGLSKRGYDARFGHGQWQAVEAMNEVVNNG